MYIKDMNFIDNLNDLILNNTDKNKIDSFSNIINFFNNFNLKNEIAFNAEKYINKHTRFKSEKINSTIFALLIKNKKFLDYYKINLNKALRAIMTLAYSTESHNCDIKLADRYICENSDLSKNQLYALIRFLDKNNIIKYIFDKGEKRVKGLFLLKDDPLIKIMNKELIKGKLSAYDKCMNYKNPSIYFNESSYITKKNHLKQNIIDITLAYNELLNTYSESNREDIQYIIIPIPIIAHILHLKERKIIKAVKNLTKSNWLKPHNLVYVNTFGMDHYFNESYKWFNKKDWRDVILEEGHPIVNEYSYIIFKEPFNKSKWFKNYTNYKNEMIQEVLKSIIAYKNNIKYFTKRDEYFCNEDFDKPKMENQDSFITNDFENNKLFEKLINTENYQALEVLMGEREQQGSIINLDIIRKNSNYMKYTKPYMISDEQISTYNISETAKKLKHLIYIVKDEYNSNEQGFHLTYYCKLVKKLQNHLKQLIKEASSKSIVWANKIKNNLIEAQIGQDIDYEYEPIKGLILHYPTNDDINKAYYLQKLLNRKYPESSDSIRLTQQTLQNIDKEYNGCISEQWLNIYDQNLNIKKNESSVYNDITSKQYIQELEKLFI